LLHKFGQIPRRPEITYEATLVLNLLLYWAVAGGALAALKDRRPFGAWLKTQAPQIALLCFSIVLSLGFLEVAIRLLRPQLAARPFERLPSETLHHVNAPNRSSLGMGNQRVVTNSDGFRTPHEREEFLKLEHRVVLLGDSYAFGLGVAGEESVAAQLEKLLREGLEAAGHSGGVGVLNTGVISYSPYLQREVFRRVAVHYRPTLTLLLLDINDIGDDHQYRQENVAGDGEAPRFEVPPLDESTSLCDLSAACRAVEPLRDRLAKPLWVLKRLTGTEGEAYDYYDFKVEIAGGVERNRFFVLRYPLEDSRPFLDATWANLSAVAGEARAAGSEFVGVVMPRYFHWNDEECPNNWEADRYGVDEPHEEVFLQYFDARAGQSDFPVWSLLPPFRTASAEGPLVFDHDPHWNARGHRAAAAALAAWVLEAGWPRDPIPPSPRLSEAADRAALRR
ncbi:MAG: SGNH/GDSL hydrolase family protein, partial [Acidobacteriota bacterium]